MYLRKNSVKKLGRPLLFALSLTLGAGAASADPRAETARETGIWTVQAGDTLYAIARKIYPGDRAAQAKLRSGLLVLNREAFAVGTSVEQRVENGDAIAVAAAA